MFPGQLAIDGESSSRFSEHSDNLATAEFVGYFHGVVGKPRETGLPALAHLIGPAKSVVQGVHKHVLLSLFLVTRRKFHQQPHP